jgi:hypothetical protein
MTLEELEAKREEILRRIGIARASFGERSVEYSDAQKALEVLDAEIEKLAAAGRSGTGRTSYAIFRK